MKVYSVFDRCHYEQFFLTKKEAMMDARAFVKAKVEFVRVARHDVGPMTKKKIVQLMSGERLSATVKVLAQWEHGRRTK